MADLSSRSAGTTLTELSNSTMLLESIKNWMKESLSDEYHKFKVRQLRYILADDVEHKKGLVGEPESFTWLDKRENEQQFILSYLQLASSIEMLSRIEHYFHHFPFRSLPIPISDHCEYMCNFYFSSFYLIRSRLKVTLNLFNKACQSNRINVGKILKLFDKMFDQELRERNSITHHEPFDDRGLSKVTITGLLSSQEVGAGWKDEHARAYRNFCKEWRNRVRVRSLQMKQFIDALVGVMLANAEFLQNYRPKMPDGGADYQT